MSYEVFILRRAQKELADLPKADYQRMREAIAALATDPRPASCKKLTGRNGWRIRTGNYRAIYEIDDSTETVTVLHVGHRKDIYS
ncbi:MAG: type II toxin-antitoxin system RelE family toxin [Pyrinomonadaceae bacterium]